MAGELLDECTAAWRRGIDFPAIWREILCINSLVARAAIQMADGERLWLEIPLTTGQRLAYQRQDGFSLLGRVAVVLRDRQHG